MFLGDWTSRFLSSVSVHVLAFCNAVIVFSLLKKLHHNCIVFMCVNESGARVFSGCVCLKMLLEERMKYFELKWYELNYTCDPESVTNNLKNITIYVILSNSWNNVCKWLRGRFMLAHSDLITSRNFRVGFSECVVTKQLRDFSKACENKSTVRSYYNAQRCRHYRLRKMRSEQIRKHYQHYTGDDNVF